MERMLEKEIKKIRKETGILVKEAKRILKKYDDRLSMDQLEPLLAAVNGLESAMDEMRVEGARQAAARLEHVLDEEFRFARKGAIREWAESLIFALLIALFLRSFVLEAFKIPSASMVPSLLVGDHIFVNKFIYGIRLPIIGKRIVEWAEPERGDVIVFAYPNDPDKDYIKRVIGLPGDYIEVRGQDVYVNGLIIEQSATQTYRYVDENSGMERHCIIRDVKYGEAEFNIIYELGRKHPTTEYTVKPRHLFVMGDNRDNSADSRSWGQVPYENIKGRAILVWWSSAQYSGIRFGRMGHMID